MHSQELVNVSICPTARSMEEHISTNMREFANIKLPQFVLKMSIMTQELRDASLDVIGAIKLLEVKTSTSIIVAL